jgi:hypothetical protein
MVNLARALIDFWLIAAMPGHLGRCRWPERKRDEQGFLLVQFWAIREFHTRHCSCANTAFCPRNHRRFHAVAVDITVICHFCANIASSPLAWALGVVWSFAFAACKWRLQ